MKKTVLAAALFALAGIASAQNATPGASTSDSKPVGTAETPKSAEAPGKVDAHKKAHAKKHVEHMAKNEHQAKEATSETASKPAPAAASSAPSK